MEWFMQALRKYAVFSGRARRKEYWFFMLFSVLISIALMVLDTSIGLATDGGIYLGFYLLFSLAILLPSLAVAVRRLHDGDRTGWWVLIGFVPLIGALVLLVFMVQDGTRGDNQYGPDPKAAG
ncbi:MAG TPA: DUF805 domain-containing protein [Xanthomonadales bacterium]|nr:DUF805 domain-containing protein [Xanthomonadales bacterium]